MNTSTASEAGAGDHLVGPVRIGEVVAEKYRIERALGVGGMGVVVEARDQVLDRRVAIKFLLPKLAGSETAVQRFVREARAATRVTSEHVVRLLEIEKLPSGTPFFVMEYLEGCDFRTLLRERGALKPSLAVDYVLQAVQAVAEGHVRGVVHRDIKPSNLFLSRRADGTALIKVLDFGIAKTVESDAAESTSLTSSDDVRLGSPAYMPPEQLQNPRDVDTRSDIWALGATLYELLCGRPPFDGASYLELASNILNQAPKPLSRQQLPFKFPEGLEQVLGRCLEKDREARYANTAELAQALAPFGSADAQMSLHRVSGMLASSSSFPALTSSPPYEHGAPFEGDCSPTLDVAGDSKYRDRRSSDAGGLATPPPPAAPRSWFVVSAAALLIAGVVAVRLLPATTPSAPVAAAQPPAQGALELVAPAARDDVEAETSEVAEPFTPPARELSPKAPTPAAPQTKASVRVNAVPAAPPSASEASAAPSPAAEPATSAAPPASLGRSPEIERLIEQRR